MANSHSNHDHKDGSSCSSGAKHDHPDHGHGHDHDHDHSHVPEVTQSNERKILISFFIIFGFMIVEAVGGWMSGSLALIADAGHMLTDAVAMGLAYAAFRFGRRAADILALAAVLHPFRPPRRADTAVDAVDGRGLFPLAR